MSQNTDTNEFRGRKRKDKMGKPSQKFSVRRLDHVFPVGKSGPSKQAPVQW